jgi:lysophospholipase L1-like esterase
MTATRCKIETTSLRGILFLLAVGAAVGGATGCDRLGNPDGETEGTGGQSGGTTGGTGTGTGGTGGETGGEATPYQTIGRFLSTPKGPSFAYSGSVITARFKGTGISMTLNELTSPMTYNGQQQGNMYDVSVDGGAPTVLATKFGVSTYTLAQGLSDGEHTIFVRKRTEALVGEATFQGFTVQGGALVPTTRNADKRLLIVGDSISCGYGNEGTTATCDFSPSTENASKSFGLVTADKLKADAAIVAWSGKGVYRNNDGTTTETLPALYARALPGHAESTFDPSGWAPDAIVVNLGTNDFASGVPEQTAFVAAYSDFVAQLRQQYPDAHIFCAVGPMLSDFYPQGQQQLTTARSYVQQVISASGDSKMHFLEFATANTDTGVGCSYHPNVSTHAAMAAQLSAALTQTLHW